MNKDKTLGMQAHMRSNASYNEDDEKGSDWIIHSHGQQHWY